MADKPLFSGLVFDENDQPVGIAYVGGEAFYVVNDSGFHRHISSEDVDRQILRNMLEQMKGHEDIVTEQTTKMLGQDDIFTRAIIQNQLKHIDEQIDVLFKTGIPEDGRQYMGMMGFRVIINIHGELIKFDQPGSISGDEDGE